MRSRNKMNSESISLPIKGECMRSKNKVNSESISLPNEAAA